MERLIKYFKPIDYHIELYIFSEKEYIDGTVDILGAINAKVIKFHAVDMKIKSVEYRLDNEYGLDADSPEDYDLEEKLFTYQPCEYKYNNEVIEIPINDEMHKRLYCPKYIDAQPLDDKKNYIPHVEFRIKFETKLNHNLQGCYVSTYDFNGQKQKIIGTQFESHYAREAFPCIDEPAAKAQFNLTLVAPDRTPADVVLANTSLLIQDYNRFTFAPTPRMSTYLLAWVIGPLKSISTVNKNGVKVTSYAALNQTTSSLEFANEVAARALEYYDEKFGIKYPLDKLDQVALPDFEAGAMENWGLVTYRESCMLAEPEASVDSKTSVAVTVTHELSHQWFGDLVTMEWWDDLWLNESFATIMEYYATDALYLELNVWQDFFTGDCVAALRRDSLRGVQSVKQTVHDPAEIATLFDGAIVYAKGARLVLMLIHLMGEEKFLQGVHDYFEKHQYQNTVGDDLWNALQPYADFNVKKFMHSWISQPGYPALQLCKNGDYTWWDQQRFLIDGTTDDSEWPLPEVKEDMSGHYLIEWGEEEFEAKLAKFDNLDSEHKLRLLIDRMLLARADIVDSDGLVSILSRFTHEDAATWSIILDIINDLKLFFPPETAAEEDYREFLRYIIHAPARAVGMKSEPQDTSDTKRLRNILAVLCRFSRDQDMIQQLADQYQDDLTKIDSELRGSILMAKMLVAEDAVFKPLLAKYQTTCDPDLRDDILGALAAARQPENIHIIIGLLEKPEIVRPQDHLFLYIYLLRNPRAKSSALAWLYEHWQYVVKISGEKSIEDYVRCTANYLNTEPEAKQFTDFFDNMKDDPILKRTLEMAKVGITARLSLIASESASVQAKVAEQLKLYREKK